MRPSIITLTTDFGTSDHYVGTMKGVILSRCPEATIIDISHNLPRFSILAGAYTIEQAARSFPSGTVHVVVIDPGVGGERRPMMARKGEQYFVAPDNGVLSLVLHRDRHARCWELSNESLWLPERSNTFHGRDIFAPVAAYLASSVVRASDVGRELYSPVILPELEPIEETPGHFRGLVLSVDHFGNVITNFRSLDFSERMRRGFLLESVSQLRDTFEGAARGTCFAYCGSSGYVEIGMNQESAAKSLQLSPADPVHLQLGH